MLDMLAEYNVEFFYHFTDVRNWNSIQKHGGLLSLDMLRKGNFQNIVYGGNEWSHEADGYVGGDRYVHLCFVRNHPMLHVAQREGRINGAKWLRININKLDFARLRFTNCVANSAGARFLTSSEAARTLDFQAIYEFIPFDEGNNRQRKCNAEKYEILVPDYIPLDWIEEC